MSLPSGTQLGAYLIGDAIGAGGMGEVYRAKDTSLGRDVAVKVLPEDLSGNPERLARLEREARLLASLNHPNIATLHGFESDGEHHFLVMELVEGQSLAERLAGGPLEIEEAGELFAQMADGLAAAHERGVIHRDLKPANVQVTPSGHVKILDFGLARADVSSRSGDSSQSPTITLDQTGSGEILGTAPYMSPEQARGRALDRTTDLWSLGCVFYECLTARRAFDGESVPDILAAVLQSEPDLDALPSATPAAVREVIGLCLAKDARQRLRDAGDVKLLLRRMPTEADRTFALPPPSARRWPVWAVGLVTGLLLGAALVKWIVPSSAEDRAPRSLDMVIGDVPTVTTPEAQISPDGSHVAYRHEGRLWIRELGQLEPRALTEAIDARLPFWSPDGEWVGFFSGSELLKMPATGGAATRIATLDIEAASTSGAAWTVDDQILLTTGSSGLLRVPAGGGVVERVVDPAPALDVHHASLLPGGRSVLTVAHDMPDSMDRIEVVSDGASSTLLHLPNSALSKPVYSPSGHLLFERALDTGLGLWAVPFSPDTLEVLGDPFLVDSRGREPSVAADGLLVYAKSDFTGLVQLALADPDGAMPELLTGPTRRVFHPALSPDGKQLAYAVRTSEGSEVWIQTVGGDTRRRVSTQLAVAEAPAWSADGARLAFTAAEDFETPHDVFVVSATGTGSVTNLGRGRFPHFAPDGERLVFTRAGEGGGIIWVYSFEAAASRPLFSEDQKQDLLPRVSPDGKYLAFLRRRQLHVTGFPSGEGLWRVSEELGQHPRWSSRGDKLYYLRFPSTLVEVDVSTVPELRLGSPRVRAADPAWELSAGYSFGPDGERLVVRVRQRIAETVPTLAVVEDWASRF